MIYIKKNNLFSTILLKFNNIYLGSNTEIINSNISKNVRLAYHASVRNSSIGNYSSIGRYTKIQNTIIGKFCSISWDVTIGARNHSYRKLSTHAFPYAKRIKLSRVDQINYENTTIGNDVWIGCNSVILPGLTISDGSVIGAGSVVTKSTPPYSISVGNPAKIIKYRFEDKLISDILDLQWWNLSNDFLVRNLDTFKSDITIESINSLQNLIKKEDYNE
jgi:acetyltransferase-like isoleucine patch superfamily enzyme